jgi:hypothetical protein
MIGEAGFFVLDSDILTHSYQLIGEAKLNFECIT